MELDPILHHIKKISSKCNKDLNARSETAEYLEENLEEKLLDLVLAMFSWI